MPSKKSYSKEKISFKRSSSSSSEESSEEHRPVKKYADLKRKKSQKESSDDGKKPQKGNLKTSSSFQSRSPKTSRVTFSNLIIAIIEDGQRNPVKKFSKNQKELYLRENKWGNLTNGLLVFFEFKAKKSDGGSVILCIGFQNTRAKINTDDPLASVIKLNAKARSNLLILEKKVGQKLEILDRSNYNLLSNAAQRKKVAHLVCEIESSSESSEDPESESEKYDSVIDSFDSSEKETPKETEKKKGWFETMTGMTSLPKFKFW